MPVRAFLAIGLALALAAPAGAQARRYPPPSDPGHEVHRPGGRTATLHVCHDRHRDCFRTINAAVQAARTGDTIRIADGVYAEGVRIRGRAKSRLRLIGNPRHPRRVVLDGRRVKDKAARQNGVLIDGADGVQLDGLYARDYVGNGFFVLNATGYDFNHLVAEHDGIYGLYAFNCVGGRMRNSEAYWHSDAGIYIGQTPPQDRPRRTFVDHVRSYENALGFSGTNMRYVTIRRSQWFNNGIGILPNVLLSERWAPPAHNAIVDNDIFWNNYSFYRRPRRFAPRPFSVGIDQPIGIGVLLFGGQDHVIEDNRIFGNWLFGVGAVEQFVIAGDLADPEKRAKVDAAPDANVLERNVVRDNTWGRGGADLNGRDLYYDGSGSGNCFAAEGLQSPPEPVIAATLAPCPHRGPNAYSEQARALGLSWNLDPAAEKGFIRHPHAPLKGYRPVTDGSTTMVRRAARRHAG